MSAARAYLSYKTSNLSWLEKYPESWTLSRLKFGLKIIGSGGTPDTGNPDNWVENDVDGYPWIAIADMTGSTIIKTTEKRITKSGLNEKRLSLWPKGTLLFSMYASLGTVSELAIEACTNQAILALVSNEEIYQPYLKYWLINMQPYLIEGASSNTQANLNAEKVKNLPLLKPSFYEQQKIANFLDRETAKIDKLIQRQESLIEKLNERRASLICEISTTGLSDSSTVLKDSKIPWLNQIPTNWNVLPLYAVANENAESNRGMIEGNLLSLSYGRVINKDINSNDGLLPESFETYQVVNPGYIIFRLTDLQNDKRSLRSAMVLDRGIITSAYLAVIPHGVNSRYLNYLMRAYDLIKVFYSMGGGLRQSMKFSDLKRLPILVPSEIEQLKIVDYLDRELGKQDALVEKAHESLALLREHRSSLISAAVTGKIDLRGA